MVQDINKLVVFGSQFFGVLVVFFSVWTQQPKLHPVRPQSTKPAAVIDSDDQTFFARLWDDPLELAARQVPPKKPSLSPPPNPTTASPSSAPDSAPPAPLNSVVASPTAARPTTRASPDRCSPSISSLVTKLPPLPSPTPTTTPTPTSTPSPTPTPSPTAGPSPASDAPTSPSASLTSAPAHEPDNLVIWNILDASSIAEARERRLRVRYAVVSAILTADYMPLRESSLTRLVNEYSQVSTDQEPKEKLLGSFEKFVARSEPSPGVPKKFVTLVWTSKEISVDGRTIDSVKWQIRANEGHREPEIHILHHGSSEDLANHVATPRELHSPEICFMRATIPGKQYDEFRGIISDDILVDALVIELSARIPALKSAERPLIKIFAESDTKYSQAMFSQLKDKFKGTADLERYSYLRGLDGRSETSAITAESSQSKSDGTADSLFQGRGIAEKSAGTPQLDYLRRLAVRLESDRKKWHTRDVVAVGILGSDIYDKMLVLQAIRPALPSAIFFTTDLDGLYLEEEHQQFTRNLVVASADSLDVKEELPPMRDSYQTVLAKKVSALLPQLAPTSTPTSQGAQVFEIATGRGIPLEFPGNATWDFPLRWLSKWWGSLLIFVLALVNAFLILAAIFTLHGEKPTDATMSTSARVLVRGEVAAACLAIVALLVLLWSKTPWWGEPVALGVSIWPSVMIRLLAFLVAILLLLLASRSFVTERERVKGKLLTAFPTNLNLPLPSGLIERVRSFISSLRKSSPVPQQGLRVYILKFFGSEKPVWRNKRFKRIVFVSLVYFFISALLFAKWPPSVPCRGALALLAERIVLALGVSLYIIHLVFCLELHLGAFRLLRALRLAFEQANWPVEQVGEKAKLLLEATSILTSIIGKTLLYPLTVLILIILSRLRNFDNWVMANSLGITFSLGALLLVIASLALWLRGSRLKKAVIEQHEAVFEKKESNLTNQMLEEISRPKDPVTGDNVILGVATTDAKAEAFKKRRDEVEKAFKKEKEELEAINEGVFAAWYNQPIFAAIFSAAAVFGSLSIASPLAQLFSS